MDRVRDTTLEQLRPDEDEQRARALAKLVRPAASELGGSAGSLDESWSGLEESPLSADQLLPFETSVQVGGNGDTVVCGGLGVRRCYTPGAEGLDTCGVRSIR